MDEPQLTPESAKALADKVMENAFIPKKVPDVEDVDAQVAAVAAAFASALLTGTDLPITILGPEERTDFAKQMVALGIRQTKHVDPEAVTAPPWIVDGVRQESMKVPEPPQHTEAEPVQARTAEAPKCPKRIKASARAVRR